MVDDDVADQQARADRFLELHQPGDPLLMPNPWDVGSVRLLEHAGFAALATTSSGFAATLGRLDGSIEREEALGHAAELVATTDLPISADLENGFADDPGGVAGTVAEAVSVGLAGCSIEDFSGHPGGGIYDAGLARERIAAAVEVAHGGPTSIVLTARAENLIRGHDDLDDTIERLQAFAELGADVVFAPGLVDIDVIRRVTESVEAPVSVLALPGGPTVAELAGAGVARVSVGGLFNAAAIGAVLEMARALQADGIIGMPDLVATGRSGRNDAFAQPQH